VPAHLTCPALQSNQAALASVMMKMQYDAARDSQEGVAVKLIDELREQHLKEAALAYAVMMAQDKAIRDWQQCSGRRRGSSKPAGGNAAHADADAGSGNGSSAASGNRGGGGANEEPVLFSAGQIDAACEDFLLQRFGLKVGTWLGADWLQSWWRCAAAAAAVPVLACMCTTYS
jgi:hypothetical protein